MCRERQVVASSEGWQSRRRSGSVGAGRLVLRWRGFLAADEAGIREVIPNAGPEDFRRVGFLFQPVAQQLTARGQRQQSDIGAPGKPAQDGRAPAAAGQRERVQGLAFGIQRIERLALATGATHNHKDRARPGALQVGDGGREENAAPGKLRRPALFPVGIQAKNAAVLVTEKDFVCAVAVEISDNGRAI